MGWSVGGGFCRERGKEASVLTTTSTNGSLCRQASKNMDTADLGHRLWFFAIGKGWLAVYSCAYRNPMMFSVRFNPPREIRRLELTQFTTIVNLNLHIIAYMMALYFNYLLALYLDRQPKAKAGVNFTGCRFNTG